MWQLLTQSSWADRIGWVLVHSLWQFTLVGLTAIILRRALQRCSAATRYGALLTVMIIMVVMPVGTWFSTWLIPAPAAAVKLAPLENVENVSPLQPLDDTLPMPPRPAASPLELAAGPQPEPERVEPVPTGLASSWSLLKSRVEPWLPEIVLAWFAGVLVAAFRPLWSWHTVRHLRKVGALPVGDAVHGVLERTARKLGLARTVEAWQSTLVKTPVVLGCFRPLVLLPLCVVTGLPAAQLEMILAHELAHIRRHDYLVNLLQTFVETLFFYHPAVWWLSRQIRNERENCCDDVAIALAGSRAEYGRALLAIEELRAASPALSLAAGGGSLLARIRRIAGREPTPRVVGGGSILGVILVSIAIAVAATWGAVPAAEKPEQAPAVATVQANTDSKDAIPPLSPSESTAKEHWSLGLKETLRYALQNSKVMRQIGAQIEGLPGLPTSPASNPTAARTLGKPGGTIPGSNQGVLITRANTDMSLATFEANVRNLVSDVETMYWELCFAYRNLESAKQGRDIALQTWQRIYSLHINADKGGEASAEARARKQYFLFCSTAEQAQSQVCQNEIKLHYMMGVAPTDRRQIRPADDPTTAKITFDWPQVQAEAMARSPEIREARWRVKQRELELNAAKNYTLPSAEAQIPLAVRKQKDGITNTEFALARDRARLRETELEVCRQLVDAIRDTNATLALTETNFNRRLASQRNLEALKISFENGRIGVEVLLACQRRLLQADSEYFRSLTNYMNSISQVHYRKGSLLEHNGIYLANLAAPPTNNPSGTSPAATPGDETLPTSDQSATKEGSKTEGQIIFAGLCLDEEGRAIADAQVSLYLDDEGALSDERLQSVSTDQAGQFRFEPVAMLPDAQTHKSYLFSAAAKGRAAVVLDRFALRRRNANRLQIVMPEAASVRGKITGADGRPVAGGKVWTGLTQGRIDGINTAMSNAEGFFEISDLEKRDGKPVPVPGHPGTFYQPTEGLLERIERQTVRFSVLSDQLRASGRHLKRGILLHGAPGTGKTLTAMYVAQAIQNRTVILLTGRGQGLIEPSCALARVLQPSIVILEDVDLVAEERTRPHTACAAPLLFELLNQMDGLADDADVLFMLTTNRPDILEPALAARLGSVDQAFEIPLPDAACRRRLFALYAQGLALGSVNVEGCVQRTEGASAAFIREMLRKAALFAADEGSNRVEDRHLDEAIRELVVEGGTLTRSLLGFASGQTTSQEDR